jgi:hypothetical protein
MLTFLAVCVIGIQWRKHSTSRSTEQKLTVPKVSLFNFFDHYPDLMTATSYDVRSNVRSEIFEVFMKALKTGSNVPVTKENVASISLLAKEFCLEELFSECSALMSISAPESIAAFSERIMKLERQVSSYRSAIAGISDRVTTLENNAFSHHSAMIPSRNQLDDSSNNRSSSFMSSAPLNIRVA